MIVQVIVSSITDANLGLVTEIIVLTDGITFFLAVLFFAISAFFELLCVLLYALVFPKLPIVKYYRSKAAAEGSKTVSADLVAGGIREHSQDVGASFLTVSLFQI